jgi:flagellar biosynthesis/type III secretory pathway protein FliH
VQCVRIHPDDHIVIEKALTLHGGNRALRIAPDQALARGSLLFDTDFGTLDSSIATQLEEIENGLVDRLRRSAP